MRTRAENNQTLRRATSVRVVLEAALLLAASWAVPATLAAEETHRAPDAPNRGSVAQPSLARRASVGIADAPNGGSAATPPRRLQPHQPRAIADPTGVAMGVGFSLRQPAVWLGTGTADREFPLAAGAPTIVQAAAWGNAREAPSTSLDVAGVPHAQPVEPLGRLEWPPAASDVGAGDILSQLAQGTGLVLALCVSGLWVLRQWLSKRSLPAGVSAELRRVESLALPNRCQIHLVEVQGRRVLVGTDPAGLKGVTVLSAPFDAAFGQEVDAEVDAPTAENAPDFASGAHWSLLDRNRAAA